MLAHTKVRLCPVPELFNQQYHCSDALSILQSLSHRVHKSQTRTPTNFPSSQQSITRKPKPQKLNNPIQSKTNPQTTASMCKETYYVYYCGHNTTPTVQSCDRWYANKSCKIKKSYVRYKVCCDASYGCRDCAGCTRCRSWSR